MQLVLLIVINIGLMALFYLLITLKLERSASTWREEKLRKTMGEIITEFNATADRNISLLEKRIDIMKRLLEKSGHPGSIDMTHRDAGTCDDESPVRYREPGPAAGEPLEMTGTRENRDESTPRSLRSMIATTGERLVQALSRAVPPPRVEPAGFPGAGENSIPVTGQRLDITIEREHSVLDEPISAEPEETSGPMDEPAVPVVKNADELIILFDQAADPYHLITELHGQGYPVEVLSRCSGIPAGEVRLVLNLRG